MSGGSGFSGPGILGRLPDLIYRTGEAVGMTPVVNSGHHE